MQALSTRVRLRVAPGSARAGVVGRYGDGWKVRVTAPPEGGRANEAVVRLLAETLEVPRDDVTVVLGPGAHAKVGAVDGLDERDIERRLTAAAEGVRR